MPYVGQALPRREDWRLVTGRGRYVSDWRPPGLLHAAFVRSPYAHARITGRSYATAARMPGVVGVYGPDILPELARTLPPGLADPRLKMVMPPCLANDVVRYVGEPVAVVIADDRYRAEDAAEQVLVEYRPEPAAVRPHVDDTGPSVHPDLGTNVVGRVSYRVGGGAAKLSEAPVVVQRRLVLDRVVAHPMEPRAVGAEWDDTAGRLTVVAATQGVFGLRAALARFLELEPDRIHVIAPDIGGGFGVKNRLYPEDATVAVLARLLRRPVRWVGDRREEFLGTNQERDQVHEATMGVDESGRIVVVVDRFVQDNGAYTVSGLIVPHMTAICLPGPYRVPHLEVEGTVVLTHKVPVGPYRGAGRPQAAFVMERLLDAAADALHLDRLEIRRRNLVPPEALPWDTGIPAGDGTIVYRDGNFPAVMEAVVEAMRRDQGQPGLWEGDGFANAVEVSAGAGFEGARVSLTPEGRVLVAAGSSSQGQGHAVTLAQVAADALGIPLEDIDVVEGDTDAVARGIGTFGSRTTVMAGNAVAATARRFQEACLDAAAPILEAARADLSWDAGRIVVGGVPARGVTLAQLASALMANGDRLPQVDGEWTAAVGEFGMATHGVRVRIDPDTFSVTLLAYYMGHDTGRMVNPRLVRGQLVGGAVQAIGQALWEGLWFDEYGQPETASLMDYRLPVASSLPEFHVILFATPSGTNPGGFKGIAEGGVIPPTAAILSAIEDALKRWGVRLDALPVTPERLYRAWQAASGGSAGDRV